MHISGDTKFVNPRRESLLRNAGHNLWAHAYSHWMLVRSETLGCRDNTVHHDQLGEMRSDRGEIFGTPNQIRLKGYHMQLIPNSALVLVNTTRITARDLCARFDSWIGFTVS